MVSVKDEDLGTSTCPDAANLGSMGEKIMLASAVTLLQFLAERPNAELDQSSRAVEEGKGANASEIRSTGYRS